jgi:hypothetical protein
MRGLGHDEAQRDSNHGRPVCASDEQHGKLICGRQARRDGQAEMIEDGDRFKFAAQPLTPVQATPADAEAAVGEKIPHGPMHLCHGWGPPRCGDRPLAPAHRRPVG